jgi:hypothetical protein
MGSRLVPAGVVESALLIAAVVALMVRSATAVPVSSKRPRAVTIFVAAVALVGAAGAGQTARAQACDNKFMVIYSQQGVLAPALARTGYFAPDANKDVWCDAPYDLRVINPASTMVKVRVFGFFSSPPAGRLRLSGIINMKNVKMSYVPPAPPLRPGSWIESPWIPLDPTARGTLTARLDGGSTVYHTVD